MNYYLLPVFGVHTFAVAFKLPTLAASKSRLVYLAPHILHLEHDLSVQQEHEYENPLQQTQVEFSGRNVLGSCSLGVSGLF
jgi:hypothetical protein